MKLQQAYISETVAVGNWDIVGYKGPGANTKGSAEGGAVSSNNNFSYADLGTYTQNRAALSGSTIGFAAMNKANLNDCTGSTAAVSSTNQHWTITVTSGGSSAGDATFTATTTCAELTPNFGMIGK